MAFVSYRGCDGRNTTSRNTNAPASILTNDGVVVDFDIGSGRGTRIANSNCKTVICTACCDNDVSDGISGDRRYTVRDNIVENVSVCISVIQDTDAWSVLHLVVVKFETLDAGDDNDAAVLICRILKKGWCKKNGREGTEVP